ncbi:RNA polymerase C-22 sterol desaturase [Aspergillus nanangensis]|uniref:sterol 22-desaturase n=1 Tax=Aspergillus nanangensis TaxID=2582783 RepID=A0AAD4GQT0_ASPNN|nr:RNA polymerase C-22 sterol desaturase [Aspergillus nanangensis]
MASVNGSFISPSADATVIPQLFAPTGLVARVLEGFTIWKTLLTLIIAAVIYDQLRYFYLKGSIIGPAWKLPFMGPFLESMDPKFHEYKAKWDSGELSCVSVFHKFVVIASTRDMSRKIFNSPAYVKPCVVDAAHKLLGADNWVFLDGKDHVEFRKGLNNLFTRSAISCYVPRMEEVYADYYKRFLQKSKDNNYQPTAWMPEFRELMCALSCRTFVGHYITDEAVQKIADDYYLITAALELVNFPIILPYTKTWYGKKASDMVMEEFAKCAAKSKARMSAGGEVSCIMDAWVKQMLNSARYRENLAKGVPAEQNEKPAQVLRDFTDYEIAQTIFTFLFASQDATSAACTWLFQLMADRPEVLDKVREENLAVRNGDVNAPLTMDLMDNLPYTRAVVKETLRYRPPVIMVPYLVKKDFPITDKITVSKGSMLIPSVWPATHDEEAYPNADSFDPDRWITGTAEQQSKNWLVFGTGPHYCLGQTYAQLNLMAMIGKASMEMDWEHTPTPESEDIKVFATIFPRDDCLLTFRPRA